MKKSKNEIMYKKMITYILVLGVISSIIVISLLIHSINKDKNIFIEKLLFNFANKSYVMNSDINMSLYYNKNIKCNTSINSFNLSKTICSADYLKVSANNQQLGTIKDISLEIKTGLFDISLPSVKSNGLSGRITGKVEDFDKRLLYGNKDKNLNFLASLSKNIEVSIDLEAGHEFNIKNGNQRLISFSGKAYSDQFIYAQKMTFNLNNYFKAKILTFKTNTEDKKITLFSEKNIKNKKELIMVKDRNIGLNAFYSYYSLEFDKALNKILFNEHYLNIKNDKKVEFNEFVKTVSIQLGKSISDYKSTQNAALINSIFHLFNNKKGSLYIIDRKNETISDEFITELNDINQEQAFLMKDKYFTTKIIPCSNYDDCLKEFDK